VGVDNIDFRSEEVELCLGEHVVVATGGVRSILRVNLVTLHLCVATVDPLLAVLGWWSNHGASNEVSIALGLAAWFGRVQVGVLGLVRALLSSQKRGFTISQVRGLLAGLRTTTILLLEQEVLRERVGGFVLGVHTTWLGRQ
jgi:hypothetical protein